MALRGLNRSSTALLFLNAGADGARAKLDLKGGADGARLPIDRPVSAIVSVESISAIIPSVTLFELPLALRTFVDSIPGMGMLNLPTELLRRRLAKLALDRRDLLELFPPLLEPESRLSSSLAEVRLRPLMPLRLILIRPMIRSETEDVPIEKPLMVISSSKPLRLLRLNIRGILAGAVGGRGCCVFFIVAFAVLRYSVLSHGWAVFFSLLSLYLLLHQPDYLENYPISFFTSCVYC